MARVAKDGESISRLIINSVKDWMKRNAQKQVLGFTQLKTICSVPEEFVTAYANLKRRAFKELEEEGYQLDYQSETKATLVGYKCPPNTGELVANKILGLEGTKEVQQDDDEEAPKPRVMIGLQVRRKAVSIRNCKAIGLSLVALADLSDDALVDIIIQVREVG